MNRIMIRGVTAGLIGTVLMGAAAVVGPAIASGAESGVDWNRPLPATQQAAAMHWRLPAVGYLKHVHRPHKRAVSHATVRLALTGSPQTIAHAMLLRRGWGEGDWNCLDALWMRESGWQTYAANASSGAYGIPQALPATKMASAGADWRTNPVTQITWGLSYIATVYGGPCAALSHSSSYGFY